MLDASELKNYGLKKSNDEDCVPLIDVTNQIDLAAHQAATSPFNSKKLPTKKQKEKGDYEKGHLLVNGVSISIENPKWSLRSGVDKSGRKWSIRLKHHYGDIENSTGADGDPIDVFIGNNAKATKLPVFIVNQVDPESKDFDEHKVLYGFGSKKAAKEAYLSNYEENWKGIGSIVRMTQDEFKMWLESGNHHQPAEKIS